ncbi:MAG TPA: endonuclease/exonuclease/phosphatase family protein [Polyangiaceae bacterium]|nr:endonuclease/exonuclease/phosphatase family protein [Polyangiaceae bacterium]
MSTLRIGTLNVWNKSGPWAERLRLIRKEIQRLEPSLLGLQEVLRLVPDGETPVFTPRTCQATEIAEGLGYEVAYGEASNYSHGLLFGNALLSRHPIEEVRVFELPGHETGERRSLLFVRVKSPFGPLPVFVTHLNWKFHHGSTRLEQVRFIVDRIAEVAPEHGELLPPVLMGDFNADPDSDEIRYLRGLKVHEGRSVFFADAWAYGGDASAGATFARENDYARRAREPSRRIDYVFVRGPDGLLRGEPIRTEVAFATPELRGGETIWASDHFGVVTDVVFGERSP